MKMDKIHELLKAFWMLSWETLTKNIFPQPFKRYQPPQLNGWYPKINKNHQGCYLAFFTQDSNLHLVFWLKSSSCNIFWPKKSTFWIFVIFYNHLHQDLNFGQFDPLAPTPWGTPSDHPTVSFVGTPSAKSQKWPMTQFFAISPLILSHRSQKKL